MVGVQRRQAIDAVLVAIDDTREGFLGRFAEVGVQHRSFIDEVVIGNRESACIRDAVDVDHDGGARARMKSLEMFSQGLEFAVIGAHHSSGPIEPQDPRVAGERAEHDRDPAVVAQVRNGFGAAAE